RASRRRLRQRADVVQQPAAGLHLLPRLRHHVRVGHLRRRADLAGAARRSRRAGLAVAHRVDLVPRRRDGLLSRRHRHLPVEGVHGNQEPPVHHRPRAARADARARMAEIVIFGAGDIARLAWHYFTHDSPHSVAAFTVDGAFRSADTFLDRPLVDFSEVGRRFPPDRYEMFVAMSYARMNHARAEKYQEAKGLGYRLATYVSSKCTW